MSKLLKLEAITNKHNLTIDYMLTFRCNYNCYYCTSHDINHPLHKYSVEEISESLNYLSSLYKDKKIQLILIIVCRSEKSLILHCSYLKFY